MRQWTTFQWALLVSLGVHGVVLTIRFVDPERFDRIFQDTPLEVVLVNAKSRDKPSQAQAIAQFNLQGGGEAEKGRAQSPLPPAPLTEAGQSVETAQKRVEQLQRQQNQMLTQVREQLAQLPPLNVQQAPRNESEKAQEEKRRQLLKLLAEIERRVQEDNARPKKRYISPATREAVYAKYYEGLRQKIEARGTQSFPEDQGKKLYGELTMVMTVDAQGRVLGLEVAQSSGNPVLDRRAAAIVLACSPFGLFSPEMRVQADQIVVVSRFKFTRQQTMETTLTGQ